MSHHQAAPSDFVHDSFFTPGAVGKTLVQTFIALIGWLVLLFPVAVVVCSVWFADTAPEILVWSFPALELDFNHMAFFLGAVFVAFFLFGLILCLHNNYRVDHTLKVNFNKNYERAQIRDAKLEELYTAHIAPAELRYSVRTFTVTKEQNLTNDMIKQTLHMHKGN